ncbi:MAG: hypothetical protein PHS42_03030 [Sulfurimonas sp.]|jgi:hypothetical protein|nr:hypothetical protein [Sulfurimonas sp.]MDD3834426.1 hypothetical protein [Sulfurimonas sp.]
MGALTKQERDSLEEIFLSISKGDDKYSRLKQYTSIDISKNISLNVSRLLKMAKIGIKESKLSQFITIFGKKKKKLSK